MPEETPTAIEQNPIYAPDLKILHAKIPQLQERIQVIKSY